MCLRKVYCNWTFRIIVSNIRAVFWDSVFEWSWGFSYVGQSAGTLNHIDNIDGITSDYCFYWICFTCSKMIESSSLLCKIALGAATTPVVTWWNFSSLFFRLIVFFMYIYVTYGPVYSVHIGLCAPNPYTLAELYFLHTNVASTSGDDFICFLSVETTETDHSLL